MRRCSPRPLGTWLAEQTAPSPAAAGSAAPGGPAAPGAGSVTVLTLHEYMLRVAGTRPSDEQGASQSLWQEQLPAQALERLTDGDAGGGGPTDGGGEAYDELILDEGQDMLRESYLDVLDLSLAGGLAVGRFRIFGDFEHQAIYAAAVLELVVNCRNTPRVARPRGRRAAARRSGQGAAAGRRRRSDSPLLPRRRAPVRASRRRPARASRRELHRPAGGRALAAQRPQVRGGRLLRSRRPPWSDRLAPLVPPGQYEPDLRSGHTRYASIYRFKGLEARAVVLTDIDSLESPHDRALFCVGATRATQRLVVLAHESLRGR
jgi:hypothetical protein